MKIALIGSGAFVDALATLARAAGTEVGPRDGADLLVVALPPADVRAWARDVAPGPGDRVLVARRGLEPDTGLRLSEVVVEETACLRVGALAGPVLPGEVRRGSPCAAVAASRFDEVAVLAQQALRSRLCRVYTGRDLAGVELAGALVEVMAVALGIARGLGLGIGAEALLVARGIAEGARLSERAGGDPRTFSGLAGVGELVACAGSDDHDAHREGLALARGETDPGVAALCATLLRREPNLPITEGVRRVALGQVRAADALEALMQREHHGEWE